MPPTRTEPAYHARFFPRSDLPEFDTHLERLGQIAHQRTEIDAFVGVETEGDLLPAEHDVGAHQFHVQAVLLDELAARGHGLAAQILVGGDRLQVFLGGDPGDFLEWSRQLGIVYRVRRIDHLADLRAPHRLYYDTITTSKFKSCGIEVIGLDPVLKNNPNNIGH
jgi:GNAT superfamily N-acetyltransferase